MKIYTVIIFIIIGYIIGMFLSLIVYKFYLFKIKKQITHAIPHTFIDNKFIKD